MQDGVSRLKEWDEQIPRSQTAWLFEAVEGISIGQSIVLHHPGIGTNQEGL